MDQDGIPSTPRGSLRQFLEQLSGAGKAIGVLTSGGDAQVKGFRLQEDREEWCRTLLGTLQALLRGLPASRPSLMP